MQVSYLLVGHKTIPIGLKEFVIDYSQDLEYYILSYGGILIMACFDRQILIEFVEWVIGFWALNYKIIKAKDFVSKSNSEKTYFFIS